MSRIVGIVLVVALFFTGCAYFIPAQRLEECEEIMEEQKLQLLEDLELMARAGVVIDSLNKELKKCQE